MVISLELKNRLPSYLQRWSLALFNGSVTHAELSAKLNISNESSRSCQKRTAEILGLNWGKQRIPHIMAHLIKEHLVHWMVLMAVSLGAIDGNSSEFRRISTGRGSIQRMQRARRKESDTAYIPLAA